MSMTAGPGLSALPGGRRRRLGGCQCCPNSRLLKYHGEPDFVLRFCTEEKISFKMRWDVQ